LEVRVEEDAMDPILCYSKQKRREWRILMVENQRRLAV
jgi:hypothetical protein